MMKAATLGILGGGQLAKMLASEAYRLGLNVSIIEGHPDSPAGKMTKMDFGKGWDNAEELQSFLDSSNFITLENEFIDPDLLAQLETQKTVFPSSNTMRLVRDKLIQKRTFNKSGIETTIFEEIANLEDAKSFGNRYGYPFILKSRELGYDGYGNQKIEDENKIAQALDYFNKNKAGIKLMAEAYVPFVKELAVMTSRSSNNEEATYPCVETIQENQVCRTVIAPADIDEEIAQKAQEVARRCVRSISGIGVFGVEFFLTHDGDLLVNEIAPRPHNSGHYTIEACVTSQFENCIRAVTGMPLGSADMKTKAAVMVNLLGDAKGSAVPNGVTELLQDNDIKLHLYGKGEAKVGRKMGHITITGNDRDEIVSKAQNVFKKISWK
ncbi:MAG: 5-(carboxyamino)imidazole ribonucleotide synthase [Candidatus Kapaibacteriales bacterium]